MSAPAPLQDIVAELSRQAAPPIAREQVLAWMRTTDLESMGAVFVLLTEHFDRIQPPLLFGDYHPFAVNYFQRCLLENPQGDWAESNYAAGASIIGWFVWCWRDSDPVQRTSTVAGLKEWLAGLYVAGNEELRTCLVHATLEHLFENPEVAEYFSDWNDHQILATAYREAMSWVEHGGRSPYWI